MELRPRRSRRHIFDISQRRTLPSRPVCATLKGSVVTDMVTFAICDDEPQMVQALRGRLAAYMEEVRREDCRVSCFSDGRSLLESGGFDVIFLDIRMEDPDGLETARQLRRRGERGLLIFVTALPEYVSDAFALEASDYLVKPLDDARFRRTMDRVLGLLERRGGGAVVVRRGGGWEVVPLAELTYCEVQGRKLYLHRQGGQITDCYGRLEELERQVDGRFFRCHRSYLVNLDCVRGCREGQVLLPRGEAVPVSRLRERALTQALLRRMGGRTLHPL